MPSGTSSCAGPPGPEPFASAIGGRFQRAETRSSRLPIDDGCSRFGTVSVRIHRQALAGRSWLSFSPSAFCADRRALSYARSRLSPGRELPTPAEVARSRFGTKPGTEPPGGIHTHFERHDLDPTTGAVRPRCVLVAPAPTAALRHESDRTLRLALDIEGVSSASLRRTGRASLDASGATGRRHRG